MKLWQKLTLATNNSELIVIYMYSVNDAAGTTLTKYFKFILLIFWTMKLEYKNQQIIHYSSSLAKGDDPRCLILYMG